MSNWSNVAGKAGTGAAIAGVSMTYYALMRRNIELEKQHQLEQQMLSASASPNGNRCKEENRKSSSHPDTNDSDNDNDHTSEAGLNGCRCLVSATDVKQDSGVLRASNENANVSVITTDQDKVHGKIFDEEPIDSTSNTNRKKKHAEIEIGSGAAICNDIVDEHHHQHEHRRDDVNKSKLVSIIPLPLPLPIPTVHCAEVAEATRATATTSNVPSVNNQTGGPKAKAKPFENDNDNDSESCNHTGNHVDAGCIGDSSTPKSPFVNSQTNRSIRSTSMPVSMTKEEDYHNNDDERVLVGPTKRTVIKSDQYGLPKKLVNSNTSYIPHKEMQEQEQTQAEIEVQIDRDDSKIDAIFINKDALDDEDSYSSCDVETSKLNRKRLIKKGTRKVKVEVQSTSKFTELGENPRPHLRARVRPMNTGRPDGPTTSSGRIFGHHHDYIPHSSWVAWPFKIFPAKYIRFVLIGLVIVAWLICAVISYGILELVYYAFAWEKPTINYRSIVSVFSGNHQDLNNPASASSHAQNPNRRVSVSGSAIFKNSEENFENINDQDSAGSWYWHW